MASLTVIFGPMFSGKTTRLIQELTRFVDVINQRQDTKCLLINHTLDNRNLEIGVSSHGSSFKGVSPLIDVVRIQKLDDAKILEYDVIGIDEAQFFDDLELVFLWVKMGKNIIVSGLISDAFLKPFGKIYRLIPMADNVYQCHSICSECLKQHGKIITPDSLSSMKAAFTFRLCKNETQIDVGASDKYIPVCRYHYDILNI